MGTARQTIHGQAPKKFGLIALRTDHPTVNPIKAPKFIELRRRSVGSKFVSLPRDE